MLKLHRTLESSLSDLFDVKYAVNQQLYTYHFKTDYVRRLEGLVFEKKSLFIS